MFPECLPNYQFPQVVDELSDDGTPEGLKALGVRMLQPDQRTGVTSNWNMVCEMSILKCNSQM